MVKHDFKVGDMVRLNEFGRTEYSPANYPTLHTGVAITEVKRTSSGNLYILWDTYHCGGCYFSNLEPADGPW